MIGHTKGKALMPLTSRLHAAAAQPPGQCRGYLTITLRELIVALTLYHLLVFSRLFVLDKTNRSR